MVGLSIILENYKDLSAKKAPQVISKGSMIKHDKSKTNLDYSTPAFLQRCCLCNKKLLSGKDIFMYKGDRAYCSVECRCKQIFMDEEESAKSNAKKGCTSSREYNCSLAAIKGPRRVPPCAASSPSSSRTAKGPRYRSNAFAC